jgi:hypothetical protein
VDTTSITVSAGAASKLIITTQPAAPAADGGALATQPVVAIQDQYGNATTATSNIVAQVGAGTWTLGGTTTKAGISGTATFSDLTAFSANSVAGATIFFTSSTLTGVTSSPFNIPAPFHSALGGVMLNGGNLAFSFTNATGLSFSVHATNDLTVSKPWPLVGPAVESPAGSGQYQFTDPNPATNAQLFYYLSQP